MDEDRLLAVEDLAERELVTVDTVRTWNRTGRGPRFMKIGRYCRYRLSDVIAWENSRYTDQIHEPAS